MKTNTIWVIRFTRNGERTWTTSYRDAAVPKMILRLVKQGATRITLRAYNGGPTRKVLRGRPRKVRS